MISSQSHCHSWPQKKHFSSLSRGIYSLFSPHQKCFSGSPRMNIPQKNKPLSKMKKKGKKSIAVKGCRRQLTVTQCCLNNGAFFSPIFFPLRTIFPQVWHWHNSVWEFGETTRFLESLDTSRDWCKTLVGEMCLVERNPHCHLSSSHSCADAGIDLWCIFQPSDIVQLK